MPITLSFITITVGAGLLIIPFILFFAWFSVRLARASLLGGCAEVTPHNFPEVDRLIKEICVILDYNKGIEAFVYQNGDVNTLLVKLFKTRIILLPHETLASTLKEGNRDQLVYLIARIVGHLKAKHMRLSWLNILIESFEKIFILNVFLYPWERATQYSGDRIGLVVCSDLNAAIMAMNKLMLGDQMAGKNTLVGSLEQNNKIKRTFFGWLSEAFSTHPHLTKRIGSLMSWAKVHHADVYDRFLNQQGNRIEIEAHLANSKSRRTQFTEKNKRIASMVAMGSGAIYSLFEFFVLEETLLWHDFYLLILFVLLTTVGVISLVYEAPAFLTFSVFLLIGIEAYFAATVINDELSIQVMEDLIDYLYPTSFPHVHSIIIFICSLLIMLSLNNTRRDTA